MERSNKRKRFEGLNNDELKQLYSTIQQASLQMDEALRVVSLAKACLASIPPSSGSDSVRAVLSEEIAPAQSRKGERSEEQMHSKSSKDRTQRAGCSNCDSLQVELRELRRKMEEHEKEREAWREFKSWWLESLKKRERRSRKRKSQKSSYGRKEGHEGGDDEGGEGGVMDAVASKLNTSTKQIWARAGMIPPDPIDESRGDEKGESSNQQSELALPLHAAAPSAAPPATSTTNPSPTRSHIPTLPAPAKTSFAGTSTPSVGYVDSTPVRNAHARRTMIASDCPDCALFYSHFSDLDPANPHAGTTERNACSRHRSTFARATTPDGYWNIGFPTTQEAEQINAQAASARRRQRDD